MGDDIKFTSTDKEKALEEFDKIPSGKDKAPSKRRTLEKVETIKTIKIMETVFTPIVVDLTYTPQTPKSEFTPIEVDLTYPTDGNIKYDSKLSVLKRIEKTINEWGENRNVGIISLNKLSDKNHNCGLKSQMTYSFWERLENRIFRN